MLLLPKLWISKNREPIGVLVLKVSSIYTSSCLILKYTIYNVTDSLREGRSRL